MITYNFPTRMLYGPDAVEGLGDELVGRGVKRLLMVTDRGLTGCGVAGSVSERLAARGVETDVFDAVDPNPTEGNVLAGVEVYKGGDYGGVLALGGGSPMDAAKAIKILATNPEPLVRYEDATGGDANVKNEMPPLFAIPTTAGTGSEVGRCSVIVIEGRKVILFHPDLLPRIAVLAPELTEGLPPHITAATGMDAFVHCFEAFLFPMFHPMADGIALEGMRLIVEQLPRAVKDGHDLDARGRMLMAAAMGATAFQKGLGMIHAMAHPLSCHAGMHHGLANALLLAPSVAFLKEKAKNHDVLANQLKRVRRTLADGGFELEGEDEPLALALERFCRSVGIEPGLSRQGVHEDRIDAIADDAFADPCHSGAAVPVTREDLERVYRAAF